jgi:hypothetical protein
VSREHSGRISTFAAGGHVSGPSTSLRSAQDDGHQEAT